MSTGLSADEFKNSNDAVSNFKAGAMSGLGVTNLTKIIIEIDDVANPSRRTRRNLKHHHFSCHLHNYDSKTVQPEHSNRRVNRLDNDFYSLLASITYKTAIISAVNNAHLPNTQLLSATSSAVTAASTTVLSASILNWLTSSWFRLRLMRPRWPPRDHLRAVQHRDRDNCENRCGSRRYRCEFLHSPQLL